MQSGEKEWKGTEQIILTYVDGKKRLITPYKIFNEYKYIYIYVNKKTKRKLQERIDCESALT